MTTSCQSVSCRLFIFKLTKQAIENKPEMDDSQLDSKHLQSDIENIKQENMYTDPINKVKIEGGSVKLENETLPPYVPLNKVKTEPLEESEILNSITNHNDDINEVRATDYFVNTTDLVNIKREIEEEKEISIKTEFLSEECHLPAMKSEDYVDEPCGSSEPSELFKKNSKKSRVKRNKKYKCPICRKIYFTLKSSSRHLSSHFGRSCVSCPFCGQFFIKKHHYLKHVHSHSVKPKIKMKLIVAKKSTYHCRYCLVEFSSKIDLNSHFRVHSAEKPFQCKICFKRYSVLYTLRRHMPVHNGLKPYKCNICLKQFSLPSLYKYHMLIHEKGKQFKCDLCGREFVQKSGLIRHSIVHQGIKFPCEICSKVYTRKVTLDSHMRLHSGEHEFKCHLCQKEFTSKGALKRHLMNHAGEKPHQCKYCSMRFLEKKNLTKHTKGHEKAQLVCEICSIGFLYKTRLRHHLLTVHGEKPFRCKICLEKFTTQSDLNKHSSIHVQIEECLCEICNIKFSKRSSYIRHLGSHGQKPFQCEICLEQYSSEKNIREHFVSDHPGSKPFKCDTCLRGFFHKRSFRKHLCVPETL